MAGNMQDWCASPWAVEGPALQGARLAPGGSGVDQPRDDSYRVLRGGSWRINAQAIRLSSRCGLSPNGRYSYVSFRLVRSLAARDGFVR